MKRDKVNQIEDSPPQTKVKHCPQCFQGKGNPNKYLGPFINYAKDFVTDKMKDMGFPFQVR